MDNPFVTALKNQGRALGAVLRAQIAMRGSGRALGLIEELAGLMFIAGGMLVLRVLTRAPTHHGIPMVAFLLSGLVFFWMFRTTVNQSMGYRSAAAVFRNNPRVTSLDVLIARAAVNVMLYATIGATAFFVMYWLGVSPPMQNPTVIVFMCFLTGVWAFGVGLCLGSIYLYAPGMRVVVNGLMHIALWTSGIMFLWPEVPYSLRSFFRNNPLFHFMELLRTAYFSSYTTPIGDWVFLLTVVSMCLALGLMLERVCRPKLQDNGGRRVDEADPFTETLV